MGAMDKMKDKAKDMLGQHGDKVDEGIDRGEEMAKEKTGGKHDDKIEKAADKARGAADRLDQ